MITFSPGLLLGKTALITGASSGLGRHFAMLLARHGARVAVGARRMADLERVVSEIETAGGHAHAVVLDVREPESIEAAMRQLQRTMGTIDVLVNNAGVAITKPALLTTEDEWQRVLDTNLSGAFRMSRVVASALNENKLGGVIINVASILGERVAKQLPAYIASKAALLKLTEALALEFAPLSIRVNAIAPGYIETELNREFLHSDGGQALGRRVPMRRFGQPADLDGALLLLASELGRYMTGATITVDGGHSLAWA